MRSTDIERTLRTINLYEESVEMRVLKALFQLNHRMTMGATLDAVHDEVSEGKEISKNWIYKILAEFEAEGFITPDRIRRPHLYLVSRESIAMGIEKRRKKVAKRIDAQIEHIEKEIEMIEKTDLSEMVSHLLSRGREFHEEMESFIVEGQDNVETVIAQEIFTRADSGDVIRTFVPVGVVNRSWKSTGALESAILEALKRGARIQSLLVAPDEQALNVLRTTRIDERAHKDFVEFIREGAVTIRLYPEPRVTYRLVALNDEKMALFMTNISRPETALITTGKGSPQLVTDAVRTFEKLWEQAVDVAHH